MSKRFVWLFLILIAVLLLAFIAWQASSPRTESLSTPSAYPSMPSILPSPTASVPQEQPVKIIPLAGPAAQSNSEISGMAWYNDQLILLPQYPARFGSGDGAVFSISKADLLAFLDGTQTQPLSSREIPIVTASIEQLDGFEGFEAIAFSGDQVFLTIEAKPNKMMGYLVNGRVTSDLNELRLDPASLIEIPPQTQIDNMTDEALLITPQGVLSFFEANGVKNNLSPIVHVFSLAGGSTGRLPMVNLEYRLTDVTPLDSNNTFWGINYFFPGDTKLTPDTDPFIVQYGEGPTHMSSTAVERLIQFQYSTDGIALTDTPPIQLQLLPDNEARNWEAIAYLDQRGLLLATDKFPATFLAFVSFP